MYHPSTRLLTILELLQARGSMSGPDLARRLEVSPRSVRRYVAMLQDMGIPIEGERGRYGQYRLRPGYKLPPLIFDDSEALAITAGLLLIQRSGGLVEPTTLERALAKLNRVLPEGLREQITALQETLVLESQPEQVLPGIRQLARVSRGVKTRRRVWLRYLDERGCATERAFDPYGVVQRGGRWYTVGHCHLRQALRVFRIDRIAEAKALEAAFEPPEDFDASTYVSRAVAMMPLPYAAEVVLATTLENARRALYPNFVTLEAVPAGVVMRCTTDDLRWLARLLSGLPFSWEVREPPKLVAALQEHALELLAKLGAGDGSVH